MASIRTFLQYMADADFNGLLNAFVRRMPRWLYRRAVADFFQLSLDRLIEIPNKQSAMLAGSVLRKATREDSQGCAALSGILTEEFQRRVAEGDQCLVSYLDDRPVNLTWLHFGRCYVRGVGLLVNAKDGDCYIYGVVTMPQYRGKGLYKHTQSELLRLLRARGISRVFQVVEEGNTIVLKTLPRFGYRPTQRVTSTTWLGVTRTVVHSDNTRTVLYRWYSSVPTGVFWI